MVLLSQCVLGLRSPRAHSGFLNRNWGNAAVSCLHQATNSPLSWRDSAGRPGNDLCWGGVSCPPLPRASTAGAQGQRRGAPWERAGWRPPCGPHWTDTQEQARGWYLVLIKLVHGPCDPVTVIHPHHPGKPRDEASIAWGTEVGVLPQVLSPTSRSQGCRGSLSGLGGHPPEMALRWIELGWSSWGSLWNLLTSSVSCWRAGDWCLSLL